MQFSPDGEWFWDGAQWRPAYSPDRVWRWDGRQWAPVVQRWRYETTEWTRRIQVILLVLLALNLLIVLALLPALMTSILQQTIDRVIAQQPPDSSVDPAQVRSVMGSVFTGLLIFSAAAGVLVAGVVVAGILKLWRWVYWYLLVSQLLAILSLPSNVVYTLGAGPIRLPAWWLAYAIPAALLQAALGVWMLVLYRRYGTWARRRVPA